MQWSIFKNTDGPVEEWVENRGANLTTGEFLADGLHYVEFKYFENTAAAMITVANGYFADDTEELIEGIVREAGYWGDFIEGFKMNDDGNIEVTIGS